MTTYANLVMTVLLSWVQGVAAWFWQLLTEERWQRFISWLGENWLWVLAAFCAVCVAVDLLVYLLRWRPYRVWATALRHLTRRGAPAQAPAARPSPEPEPMTEPETAPQPASESGYYLVYANGEVAPASLPEEEPAGQTPPAAPQPAARHRRSRQRPEEEGGYGYMPPVMPQSDPSDYYRAPYLPDDRQARG